jgi:hypothetical protein
MAEEEKTLKIFLYMCTDKGTIFLADYDSIDGIAEALKDVFRVLWTHGALAEIKGFKIEWEQE